MSDPVTHGERTVPAARQEPRAVHHARGSRLSQTHREWLAATLFLAPDFFGLLIFIGIPMVLALSLGLFDVNGFGTYKFIGIDNYRHMVHDPLFRKSLRVSAIYVVVSVPAVYVVGLGLALLVKQKLPLIGIFRSMFFMPYVISLVVIGVLWQFMLIDRLGVINHLFMKLGILTGYSWLGDPHLALGTILFITVWLLMGFYMVIFLAGLQDIPQEYYDAARIDGAGPWNTFVNITLPLLKPTSFFVLLVLTVTAVAGEQGFDLVYIMTQGGPANSTSLILYYIYQQAFQYGHYGYAAAMASVLVAILVVLTGILFVLTKGGRFDFD